MCHILLICSEYDEEGLTLIIITQILSFILPGWLILIGEWYFLPAEQSCQVILLRLIIASPGKWGN